MPPPQQRPAAEWFAAAERCYAQEHQACPACRQRHCVFRSQWGTRTEYHCTACDFSASSDESTGQAVCAPGSAPATGWRLGLLS
jgi:hypothetical protein